MPPVAISGGPDISWQSTWERTSPSLQAVSVGMCTGIERRQQSGGRACGNEAREEAGDEVEDGLPGNAVLLAQGHALRGQLDPGRDEKVSNQLHGAPRTRVIPTVQNALAYRLQQRPHLQQGTLNLTSAAEEPLNPLIRTLKSILESPACTADRPDWHHWPTLLLQANAAAHALQHCSFAKAKH